MRGEIVEIEIIWAIANANDESEELVVLKDGSSRAVSGFLSSMRETSVARRESVNLGDGQNV